MMFAIMAPVIMDLPDSNPFTKAIALGIPFACNIGGIGTPIGTPPNAFLAAYLLDTQGIEVGFAQWMLLGLPVAVVMLLLVWWWPGHLVWW